MPPKKQKSAKDEDSKKAGGKPNKKITQSEENESDLVTKEEQTIQLNSANENAFNSTSEISKQEPISSPEDTVDIKYEEPVLTSIIVENYEGEKDKGLFEGFGKAFYKGGNVYEGEFHLGMMHGKGKYVWSEGIIYEGQFLNNEITGQGLYRWCRPKHDPSKWTTYDGQVYNGKRHGEGTFKSGSTPVIYTGEWNLGKRCGKGKIIYDQEGLNYYEGDWVNNKKFGWGIRHYPSGNVYEGMWVNDIRHGEGTMRWFDKNQIYTGQWENGIQNGLGEHNWYSARIEMTQYSLRNTYYGNFKNGKRHGQGTFLYANGTKYEGTWENNMKHGYGRFTFKDGSVYEGYFEDDKMTDSPTFKRSSKLAQEISKIKTRIPSAGTTLNIHLLQANKEVSRHDFDLKLDLSSILDDFENPETRVLESNQAHKTIIRYLDLFKQVYRFYSQLGFDSSPDNTYVLNRMQFWRFLKDCKIHLNDIHLTLMDFDRLLNPKMNSYDLHCPYDKILTRDFFNNIVLIAWHLYKDQFDGSDSGISWCIEKLIVDNILPYACNVQGYFYSDCRKTLNILNHMVKCYEIYKFLCTKRVKKPHDFSITMRQFLKVLSQYKLLDNKNLSTREIIEVMARDNPLVFDSENCYNLELEITFLEFFETLIGCALRYKFEQATEKQDQLYSHRLTDRSIQEETNSNENKGLSSSLNEELKKETGESTENKNEDQNDTEMNSNCMNTNREENEKHLYKQELDLWIEKNNLFFNSKFFPLAENYIHITKLANGSL